jgi:shikimate dehydrogenase
MKTGMSAFLKAVQARRRPFQVGSDRSSGQIPAFLEYFGPASTTPENLRAVARLGD